MKNRRNFVLINPNLQLKIVFFVNILCFITFALYPIALYLTFKKIDLNVVFTQNFKEEIFIKLLAYFFAFQLLFQLFMSYMLIFYTHKLAGPIYRTSKFLESLNHGKEIEHFKFRDNDFFHSLTPILKVLKQKEENKRRVVINLEREIEALLDNEDQDIKRNALFFLKSEVSSLK